MVTMEIVIFQQISHYCSLLCILIISYCCQIYFDESIDDYWRSRYVFQALQFIIIVLFNTVNHFIHTTKALDEFEDE